jgi:predicted acetyltransferase
VVTVRVPSVSPAPAYHREPARELTAATQEGEPEQDRLPFLLLDQRIRENVRPRWNAAGMNVERVLHALPLPGRIAASGARAGPGPPPSG